MKQFSFILLLLLIGTALAVDNPNWQLPTPEGLKHIQERCQQQAAGDEAEQLRCLVLQLGLWTDERGYNARRIAKIFAARQQKEELIVVVEYCNKRERRPDQSAQWAYAAYKCATAGTMGEWVREYRQQIDEVE